MISLRLHGRTATDPLSMSKTEEVLTKYGPTVDVDEPERESAASKRSRQAPK
jgi:hypothetical protein